MVSVQNLIVFLCRSENLPFESVVALLIVNRNGINKAQIFTIDFILKGTLNVVSLSVPRIEWHAIECDK